MQVNKDEERHSPTSPVSSVRNEEATTSAWKSLISLTRRSNRISHVTLTMSRATYIYLVETVAISASHISLSSLLHTMPKSIDLLHYILHSMPIIPVRSYFFLVWTLYQYVIMFNLFNSCFWPILCWHIAPWVGQYPCCTSKGLWRSITQSSCFWSTWAAQRKTRR